MSFDPLAFLDPPAGLAYGVLTAVADALRPVAGDTSAAVAVVVFTLAVRAVVLPLSRSALRGGLARQRLVPRAAELRRRHRRDPERAQREITELYRKEGVSPLGGCLPALAQTPFFMVLYRAVSAPLVAGHANVLLTNAVFGMPLGGRLIGVLTGALGVPGLVAFGGLAVALALVAWWASRTMPPGAPAEGWQRLAPFATLLSLAVVPYAAGLYVLTSTAWATGERALAYRRAAAA